MSLGEDWFCIINYLWIYIRILKGNLSFRIDENRSKFEEKV